MVLSLKTVCWNPLLRTQLAFADTHACGAVWMRLGPLLCSVLAPQGQGVFLCRLVSIAQ